MAHLLLFYQLLRAKREYNGLTANAFRVSSKKSRIKKAIESQQKRFESEKTRIQNQSKRMQSYATTMFQNMFGLGTNSFNPMNFNGVNGFVAGFAQSLLANGIDIADSNGSKTNVKLDNTRFSQLLTSYQQLGSQNFMYAIKDGQIDKENRICSDAEAQAFLLALNQGSNQQHIATMQYQQMSSAYASNVSIWEEAQLAALEAQQDAVLEPLNYEETMIELEETTLKSTMEEKKAEIDNIKQELSERVKDDAVSFGLS